MADHRPTTPTTTSPLDEGFAFGLTHTEVDRLREILSAESGRQVPTEEAWQRAIELIALFRMLLGPLPEDPGS